MCQTDDMSDASRDTASAGDSPAPENPYGGAAAAGGGPKRVRTRHFQNAKREGIKITGLTSYDQLTARIFDQAGIDFLTRAGHITDDRRQEFILLSDVLGVSMLTIGVNHPAGGEAAMLRAAET